MEGGSGEGAPGINFRGVHFLTSRENVPCAQHTVRTQNQNAERVLPNYLDTVVHGAPGREGLLSAPTSTGHLTHGIYFEKNIYEAHRFVLEGYLHAYSSVCSTLSPTTKIILVVRTYGTSINEILFFSMCDEVKKKKKLPEHSVDRNPLQSAYRTVSDIRFVFTCFRGLNRGRLRHYT